MTHADNDVTYPGGTVRLYVPEPLDETELNLGEDQSHYLANVMRAKTGQRVRIFNGTDGEWLAMIQAITKRHVTVRLEKKIRRPAPEPEVTLLLAPIKRTPFDYVIQKAVELGVARIIPVLTERTIVARVNLERLQANAIEAAEQSDRLTVPEIAAPAALGTSIRGLAAGTSVIFCDEAGDAAPLAQALSKMPLGPMAILTGPEGGFSPQERAMLRGQTFVIPVSLGPRILRADTAALAALAVWQSTHGDWK